MVGFAMYGLDPDDGAVNFLHFMIDGKEQGKGYGKTRWTNCFVRSVRITQVRIFGSTFTHTTRRP
jgi:hypothetical protein